MNTDQARNIAREIVKSAEKKYGNARYGDIDTVIASEDEWVEMIAANIWFNRSDWRNISSAPRDGTAILACRYDYDSRTDLGSHPRTIRWTTYHPNAAGKFAWRNSYGNKEKNMTHWMPLPISPGQFMRDSTPLDSRNDLQP